MQTTRTIWAASALLSEGWKNSVEIAVDADGNIASVTPDCQYRHGERVACLIPAIANVHSHAHQRAMAGLGERAGLINDASQDSFWTWRQVMYHYLERIQPEHLQAIAAQLYVEMLKHGYSCVGEFQYLHHDPRGMAYANPAEMSLRCLEAARTTGIGFTALPVLYRYGGFGAEPALPAQRRFLNDADSFVEITQSLQQATRRDQNASVGIAPHSLRAVSTELLTTAMNGLDNNAAIHIHIAEQIREVEDCIEWSGQRPVERLFGEFDVDQRWCLIHATHMTHEETRAAAQSGCVVGLCPTTEANLGDGLFNATAYFAHNGCWAVGSDSHASVDPVEELRWLEYTMRLHTRTRNVLVSSHQRHTGRHLFDGAVNGGAQACGRQLGLIQAGHRADFIVLDTGHPRLYGRSEDHLLDSWIFSGNDNLIRDVYVGGRKVIANGHHADEDRIADDYRQTLDALAV